MDVAAVEERLGAVGSSVSRARELLAHPSSDALALCEQALLYAASELASCRESLEQHRGRSDLLWTARRIRGEVLLAGRMLQSAAAFYAGWERILGAVAFGYTASGEPSAIPREGKICCRV